MIAEVFLAAVTQPNTQHLRNLLALARAKTFVKRERFLPLTATRRISVRIPSAACSSDPAAGLFDQCVTDERLGIGVLFGRHQ